MKDCRHDRTDRDSPQDMIIEKMASRQYMYINIMNNYSIRLVRALDHRINLLEEATWAEDTYSNHMRTDAHSLMQIRAAQARANS